MKARDRRRQRDESVEARIREALDALRPLLHIDASRIELLEFRARERVAVLRLDGDCPMPGCSLTAATLRQGIEAHLRARVPEIREILAI